MRAPPSTRLGRVRCIRTHAFMQRNTSTFTCSYLHRKSAGPETKCYHHVMEGKGRFGVDGRRCQFCDIFKISCCSMYDIQRGLIYFVTVPKNNRNEVVVPKGGNESDNPFGGSLSLSRIIPWPIYWICHSVSTAYQLPLSVFRVERKHGGSTFL
jgi:hypothetical protein